MALAKRKPVPLLSRDRRWRLRRFVAAYGVYIALAVLLLAAAVLTPKLYAVDTIAAQWLTQTEELDSHDLTKLVNLCYDNGEFMLSENLTVQRPTSNAVRCSVTS